jgi:hypothetical protein
VPSRMDWSMSLLMFSCKLVVFSMVKYLSGDLMLTSDDTVGETHDLGPVVTGNVGVVVDIAGEEWQVLGDAVVGHGCELFSFLSSAWG